MALPAFSCRILAGAMRERVNVTLAAPTDRISSCRCVGCCTTNGFFPCAVVHDDPSCVLRCPAGTAVGGGQHALFPADPGSDSGCERIDNSNARRSRDDIAFFCAGWFLVPTVPRSWRHPERRTTIAATGGGTSKIDTGGEPVRLWESGEMRGELMSNS
jgi:hypothetical protein